MLNDLLDYMTLVCFAVNEEARFFKPGVKLQDQIQILLTGIGQRNAKRALEAALAGRTPRLVLSCGFAGGLQPNLVAGTVVFAVDSETALESPLRNAGALPARFHCADRVATTAAEKRALRESTGADAVEMESGIICDLCRARNIPSGTIRVILDTASEDLPLDFNNFMTEDDRMDYGKLAGTLLKSPGKVGALLRLQKQSTEAAKKLAEVLNRVVPTASNR